MKKEPKKTHELPVSHVDRNLGRIRLRKFNGDKTKFENFWATFESIVDETDEPAKFKMIRLKSCLEGKAEEGISKLGFCEEAYKEAKNTLKRGFGGERRQLQNYLEDVKKITPLQEGSICELEKFPDILVSIIVSFVNIIVRVNWNLLVSSSLLWKKFRRPCCQDIFAGLQRTIV